MTVRKKYSRHLPLIGVCLFLKKYNRGEVLIQGGRCSYTLTVYNPNEKKNKTQICSHLHKGGGRENCQGEGVYTSAQRQTRKGSELLSEVLRVPKIVEF